MQHLAQRPKPRNVLTLTRVLDWKWPPRRPPSPFSLLEAGLSASLFLSHLGVRSLLVERHAGTSIHLRARWLNARTMELYRELGVDEAVREGRSRAEPERGHLPRKIASRGHRAPEAEPGRQLASRQSA